MHSWPSTYTDPFHEQQKNKTLLYRSVQEMAAALPNLVGTFM